MTPHHLFRPILTAGLVLTSTLVPLSGAITAGLLNDFQDGTTQGWSGGASPTNVATGGPAGAGDRYLQVGNGGNFATFNTGASFTGAIDTGVTAFFAELLRPAGDATPLEIRLNLYAIDGSRWASSDFVLVGADGIWATYAFPIDEASLTRVLGTGSYASLVAGVERTMFRHDPGLPRSGGTAVNGTIGIDNVRAGAIPEPGLGLLLIAGGLLGVLRRRR